MKLFVAKLNRETTEVELKENFSQFGGVVSCKIVSDRDTGQSKCFGFIEMDSSDSGQAAIAAQNGQEFMGFTMVVKAAEDKPRSPRPSFGGDGDRQNSGRSDSSNSRGTDSSRAGFKSGGNSPSSSGGFDSRSNDKPGANKFPASSTTKKKKATKKGKGGLDKYADGGKGTQHEKRPKSNRNQWLDDLEDF
jgi:cold-inducible RNA-binding protein